MFITRDNTSNNPVLSYFPLTTSAFFKEGAREPARNKVSINRCKTLRARFTRRAISNDKKAVGFSQQLRNNSCSTSTILVCKIVEIRERLKYRSYRELVRSKRKRARKGKEDQTGREHLFCCKNGNVLTRHPRRDGDRPERSRARKRYSSTIFPAHEEVAKRRRRELLSLATHCSP